ncbi:MAG: hypothetical protein HY816_08890 [Candidatus Wallbacteria bacterium]|nr:hypothetical protein [Candidatus Wallbacteria bacterium]
MSSPDHTDTGSSGARFRFLLARSSFAGARRRMLALMRQLQSDEAQAAAIGA